ncbi:hypothetical protein PVAP13_9KG617201 [Panicum virgatum]|uniref:Uncharacterized protein n=1 Tax=Panicum virgatum TaxID=38727 RepID=A0A8T0P0U6_PANVG|nr:hypothetical protein PVAP13_9KG617201 [Panicum virgatum]
MYINIIFTYAQASAGGRRRWAVGTARRQRRWQAGPWASGRTCLPRGAADGTARRRRCGQAVPRAAGRTCLGAGGGADRAGTCGRWSGQGLAWVGGGAGRWVAAPLPGMLQPRGKAGGALLAMPRTTPVPCPPRFLLCGSAAHRPSRRFLLRGSPPHFLLHRSAASLHPRLLLAPRLLLPRDPASLVLRQATARLRPPDPASLVLRPSAPPTARSGRPPRDPDGHDLPPTLHPPPRDGAKCCPRGAKGAAACRSFTEPDGATISRLLLVCVSRKGLRQGLQTWSGCQNDRLVRGRAPAGAARGAALGALPNRALDSVVSITSRSDKWRCSIFSKKNGGVPFSQKKKVAAPPVAGPCRRPAGGRCRGGACADGSGGSCVGLRLGWCAASTCNGCVCGRRHGVARRNCSRPSMCGFDVGAAARHPGRLVGEGGAYIYVWSVDFFDGPKRASLLFVSCPCRHYVLRCQSTHYTTLVPCWY